MTTITFSDMLLCCACPTTGTGSSVSAAPALASRPSFARPDLRPSASITTSASAQYAAPARRVLQDPHSRGSDA